MKVPGLLTRSLDDRAQRIRNELDEARKLREEAQQLLAELPAQAQGSRGRRPRRSLRPPPREAESIVTDARQKDGRVRRAPQRGRRAERSPRPNAMPSTRCAPARSTSQWPRPSGSSPTRSDAKMSAELFTKSMGDVKAGLN